MAGRYKSYPEYKNSEVEWLGDVPSHWTVSKFGFLKTVLTDFTANGSFADLKKNAVYQDEPSFARLVRLTDLRLNLENENGVWINESGYNYLSKSALFGGEFLLANVGAYAGLFYQMPYGAGNASLAPNMFMAKFDQGRISSEYMAFVGQSECASKQLILFATSSSAQPKLNKDDFKSVRFCFPSLEEQKNIANFLGHETAKIDTLIEKQQQLIQLLKEKRQAVISHAVTKGLNPNAKMRDSGVGLLGEIPEHWSVSQLKYKIKPGTSITYGIVQAGPHVEDGIPYIKTSDMSGDTLPLEGYSKTSKEIDESYKRSRVYEGDIIVAIRATVGKCMSVPKEISGANLTQGTAKVSPGKDLKCEYLLSYLSSKQAQSNFDSIAKGVTFKEITLDMLRKFPVLVPPLEEQDAIFQKISTLDDCYSRLISASEEKTRLLQERRTSLISAAVTGKIDVRNWIAPKGSQTHKEVAA